MTTVVALVRSINVGGRNKVAMEALRSLAEGVGLTDVTTYLQSGNLVGTTTGTPATVEQSLSDAIADQMGLAVPVVVRTADQLSEVIGALPFPHAATEPKALHVNFLQAEPDAERIRSLLEEAQQFAPDCLAVVGREAFVHSPGGYADTTLTTTFLERRLGVVATARNWRTVTVLAGMVGAGTRR
jgi:uncharacterized protein (DUF1697 family)